MILALTVLAKRHILKVVIGYHCKHTDLISLVRMGTCSPCSNFGSCRENRARIILLDRKRNCSPGRDGVTFCFCFCFLSKNNHTGSGYIYISVLA